MKGDVTYVVVFLLAGLLWSNTAQAEIGWPENTQQLKEVKGAGRAYGIAGAIQFGWAGIYSIAALAFPLAQIASENRCNDDLRNDPDSFDIFCRDDWRWIGIYTAIGSLTLGTIIHVIAGALFVKKSVRYKKWYRYLTGESQGWVPSVSVAAMPGKGGGAGLTWQF